MYTLYCIDPVYMYTDPVLYSLHLYSLRHIHLNCPEVFAAIVIPFSFVTFTVNYIFALSLISSTNAVAIFFLLAYIIALFPLLRHIVILRFEPAHINRKTNTIIPGLEKQEITARQMKNI